MPIYEYMCDACGWKNDYVLKLAEYKSKDGTDCPECKKGKLHLKPNVAGFTDSWSLGREKPPSDFREMLGAIGKANPGHTMNLR